MSYNIILSMSQQSPPLRRLISQIVYVKMNVRKLPINRFYV